MQNQARSTMALDLPWRTIVRVLLTVALVWLWLRLWRVATVLLVAAILAVTLEPAVVWLERRGIRRPLAAVLCGLAVVLVVGTFLALSWSSLVEQSRTIGRAIVDQYEALVRQYPALNRLLDGGQGVASGVSSIASAGLRLARSTMAAVVICVLGLILTVYLLIDGKRTYRWVRGYFPRAHRERVDRTAADLQRVIRSYFIGNALTSLCAFVFVLVGLLLLNVPAALMLALLAGVFDFVPVLGFVLSAGPAVLLALTVSPLTALAVVALYIAYDGIENYFLAPKVYGNQLRLSDVAVLVAFSIGAELGGVVGALISLPLAAAYPTIERIWLADKLGPEVVEEHRRVEQEPVSS